MKKRIIFFTFVFIYFLPWFHVCAQENWRTEFDNLCGKTEESMTMKLEELKDLVIRCDKLKPAIEASDNPQKKVFLKRLEMCKNLFSYMVEVREKERK
jgi:hypothetical protein